jgi:hypothetical protein
MLWLRVKCLYFFFLFDSIYERIQRKSNRQSDLKDELERNRVKNDASAQRKMVYHNPHTEVVPAKHVSKTSPIHINSKSD